MKRLRAMFEALNWLTAVVALPAAAFLAYELFRGPPLTVQYYRVVPDVAMRGDTVIVESAGVKHYGCPVISRWYILDADNVLHSLQAPAGFNRPTGKIREWRRPLIIPGAVAIGPAQHWEEVEYNCMLRDYPIYSPRADVRIIG